MTDRDEFEKWWNKEGRIKCNLSDPAKGSWDGWQGALSAHPPVDVQAIEAVIAELMCTSHVSTQAAADLCGELAIKLADAIGAKV
jgi:hypothetical protein